MDDIDSPALNHLHRFKVPDFKAAIPGHLLGELTKQERYVIEALSVSDQHLRFLSETAASLHNVAANAQQEQKRLSEELGALAEELKNLSLLVRDIRTKLEAQIETLEQQIELQDQVVQAVENKTAKLLRWRDIVTSKWSVVIGALLILTPVLVRALWDYLVNK